jgi:hypothetical protein
VIRSRVVKNGLPEIRRKAPAKLQQIHEDTAAVIESLQKQLVRVSANPPAGHTHIRDTIKIKKDGKRIAVIEGDSEHDYGWFLNKGTEFIAADNHIDVARAEGARYRDKRIAELAREIGK